MSRRRGSATALNASEVVAALAMLPIYSHIGICQALFCQSLRQPFSSAAYRSKWVCPSDGLFERKVSYGSVFGKVRIPLSPPKATLKCYYPSLRVIGVLAFPRLY